MLQPIVALALVAAPALAQYPGHGVAKTTYACYEPFKAASWLLKYLPVTSTEDSCAAGTCASGIYQGRVQLVVTGYLRERKCDLLTALGGAASANSNQAAVTAPAGVAAAAGDGPDCGYAEASGFANGTALYSVYAHDADTCCKACAATDGCAGANWRYTAADSRVGLPNAGEGFGIHLVNVWDSPTTGGLEVAELETKFAAAIGDLATYSSLLDYGVAFYAVDLDAYADAFAKDGVPTLKASWTTAGGDTYYSLFVAVPHSVLVVELISDELTGGDDGATLETRMSDRNAARLKTEAKATPNNLLYEVNVNRATTNLTAVTAFYEDALNCTVTLDATAHGAHRRCFMWGPDPTGDDWALSDVCFVERAAAADAAFSVRDFEDNFWAVHEANIDGPNHGDKYNDFHYAMDGDGLQPAKVSGDYLVDYFTKHTPTLADRYWYFLCVQHYIIDPTGWCIQVDLDFSDGDYPGCTGPPPSHL